MIVYRIRNIVNGRAYIGATTQSLSKRFSQHKTAARLGENTLLYQDMLRYGFDKFTIVEIDRAYSMDELYELERRHIERCNTLAPHGYNMTLGGVGSYGYCASQETKEKLSIIAQNRDDEHNKKIAEKVKALWDTPEYKEKMLIANKDKKKYGQKIEINGILKTSREWGEQEGLHPRMVLKRYQKGIRGLELLKPSNRKKGKDDSLSDS